MSENMIKVWVGVVIKKNNKVLLGRRFGQKSKYADYNLTSLRELLKIIRYFQLLDISVT